MGIGLREQFVFEPGPAVIAGPQQTLADTTGLVVDYQWQGDSLTDLIAAETLVAAGASPEFNIALPPGRSADGGERVRDSDLVTGAYRFTDGIDERFEAAAATLFDLDASASALFVLVFRTTGTPAAAHNLLGKRETAGSNIGYELQINAAGNLVIAVSDGTPVFLNLMAVNYADQNWHTVFFQIDRTNNLLRVTTEQEAPAAVTPPVGSLSNAVDFSVGANRGLAAGADIALLAVATGTKAEVSGDIMVNAPVDLGAEMYLLQLLDWIA